MLVKKLRFSFFIGLTYIMLLIISMELNAQTKIFVFSVKQEIDPVSEHFVATALAKATELKSDLLILELDTYGGALDAADKIRSQILSFPKPIYVLINKNAASAGALISLACDSIYMSAGGNIGSATVVNEQGTPLPEKYQSYMRSLMRATAQANGRDPIKAEQMVGVPSVEDSNKISKVLAYTTSEAIANGFCEAEMNSIDDILKRNQLSGKCEIFTYQQTGIEKIISIFLNPYLRGVLILIMIAGIYYEMSSPGIGFALLASLSAAVLYFLPSYLNGLAENWEILLFLLGIVLLALEIFVIPGFGVAGIVGIACMIASLILAMLNNQLFDFTFVKTQSMVEAISIALVATMLSGVLLFALGEKLFKSIALQTTLDSQSGFNTNFISIEMTGKKGIAHTVLRPSGKVKIEEQIYDAYSGGDYIEAGQNIEVIGHLGTQLKVKRSSDIWAHNLK
jgi:membrane-bound serine protease (ClpP class)